MAFTSNFKRSRYQKFYGAYAAAYKVLAGAVIQKKANLLWNCVKSDPVKLEVEMLRLDECVQKSKRSGIRALFCKQKEPSVNHSGAPSNANSISDGSEGNNFEETNVVSAINSAPISKNPPSELLAPLAVPGTECL